jgi:hypothetical protein
VPVRHDIQVGLELVDDVVRGGLPDVPGSMFEGRGKNTLAAVLAWLGRVDQSIGYVPAYRKARE